MLESLPSETRPTAFTRDAAIAIAQNVFAIADSGKVLDAQDVLERWPGIWQYASIAIDIAYEEYCQRCEWGEVVDPETFSSRFKPISTALLRQIRCHNAIASGLEKIPRGHSWPPEQGTFLNFDLLTQIGTGGSSRVYLARDLRMGGRPRVVKVCQTNHREGLALAKMEHPSIVDALYCLHDAGHGLEAVCMPAQGRFTLFDVITEAKKDVSVLSDAGHLWRHLSSVDEIPRLCPEYAGYAQLSGDTRSYSELLQQWGFQIAKALSHAHAQGFIHGDVKPSNILISWSGDALLMDFGAAQRIGDAPENVSGTIPYLAPEILRLLAGTQLDCEEFGEARTESRLSTLADVFAWGATFYEAAVLKAAFPLDPNVNDILSLVRSQFSLRFAGDLDSRKPVQHSCGRLIDIARRTMSINPAERPQSAVELMGCLDHLREVKATRAYSGSRFWLVSIAALFVGMASVSYLTLRPNYEKLAENEGLNALRNSEWSRAESALRMVDNGSHPSPNARAGLAYALLRQQRYEAALDVLATCETDRWQRRCFAYSLLCSGRDPARAIDAYRELLSDSAADAGDYNNGGFALLRSPRGQNLNQSAAWLQQATELDPVQAVSWANLLIVQRRMELANGGKVTIENALQYSQRFNQSPQVLLEAAITLSLAGRELDRTEDEAESEKTVEKTLELSEQAVRSGADGELLKETARIWPRIAENGRLQQLFQQKANGPRMGVWSYLVTPPPPEPADTP